MRSGIASNGGRLLNGALLREPGSLAAGVAPTLTYRLQPAENFTADYTAGEVQVSSADEPALQRSCRTALVIPSLTLAKIAPLQAAVNDTIAYELTVENTGPVLARRGPRLPPRSSARPCI